MKNLYPAPENLEDDEDNVENMYCLARDCRSSISLSFNKNFCRLNLKAQLQLKPNRKKNL